MCDCHSGKLYYVKSFYSKKKKNHYSALFAIAHVHIIQALQLFKFLICIIKSLCPQESIMYRVQCSVVYRISHVALEDILPRTARLRNACCTGTQSIKLSIAQSSRVHIAHNIWLRGSNRTAYNQKSSFQIFSVHSCIPHPPNSPRRCTIFHYSLPCQIADWSDCTNISSEMFGLTTKPLSHTLILAHYYGLL